MTAYYSVPSSPEVVSGNVATKFGVTMPEPVFLLTLWILYHLGSFFLIASEDYVEFCVREADKLFQEIVRLTFYAILLIISQKRCRALRVVRFEVNVQSWERYFASPGH